MAFSDKQVIAIIAVRMSAAFVTSICCLLIFAFQLYFKKYRIVPNRLICHLIVAIFFDSLTNYLTPGVQDVPALCIIQGITMQFFQVLTFLWELNIAVYLFSTLVLQFNKPWMELALILFAYFWAFICTLLPATTNSYGFAGTWCWIKADRVIDTVWRFSVFYAHPLVLVLILIFLLYLPITVKLVMALRQKGDSVKKIVRNSIRLIGFPAVFLVIWAIPLTNRITNWAGYEIFVLFILHGLTAPLLGLFYAILICISDKEVRYFVTCRHGKLREHQEQVRQFRSRVFVDEESGEEYRDDTFLENVMRFFISPFLFIPPVQSLVGMSYS